MREKDAKITSNPQHAKNKHLSQNPSKKPDSTKLLAMFKTSKGDSQLLDLLIEIGEAGGDLILVTEALDIFNTERILELSHIWPIFVKVYYEKLENHNRKLKAIKSAMKILAEPALKISEDWNDEYNRRQKAYIEYQSEYIDFLDKYLLKDYFQEWFSFQRAVESTSNRDDAKKEYLSYDWWYTPGGLELYAWGKRTKNLNPKVITQSSHNPLFSRKIVALVDELKKIGSENEAYKKTGKLLNFRYPDIYKDGDHDLVRQRYYTHKGKTKSSPK